MRLHRQKRNGIGGWTLPVVLCGVMALAGCQNTGSLSALGFPSSDTNQTEPAPVNQPVDVGGTVDPTRIPGPVAVDTPTEPEPGPAVAPTIAPAVLPTAPLPLSPAEEVRVGILLPLSGRDARLGEAMLDAAGLALFDAADTRFRLLPRDTAGTTIGAEQAALSVINDGADLILGPLYSANAKAVAGLAEQRGVSVIAFSNDSTAAGRNVFLIGLLPEDQINRIIGYSLEQDRRRIAVLAPDTANGRRLSAIAADTIQRGGGELARTMFYAADGSDLDVVIRDFADFDIRAEALELERADLERQGTAAARRALTRLTGLDTKGEPPYDAVFMPVPAGQLREVASRLAYYDVDGKSVQFLGLSDWGADPSLLAEPSLHGAWFPSPPTESWEVFQAHYADGYGQEPPRLASIAYDAAALAAVLGRDEQGINPAEITFPLGFAGVDGLFRFNRTTGLVERGLAVLELRRRGAQLRDPAPQSFDLVPLN